MHPILIADIAAERHADLLRAAEARRRFAGSAQRRRPGAMSWTSDGLSRAVTALRGGLATSRQPSAELCCA